MKELFVFVIVISTQLTYVYPQVENYCISDPCHTNATCESNANIGNYSCTCDGYLIGDGIAECKVENYCISKPCHANATCENDANIGNYSCTCDGYLIGDGIAECKVENYCLSNPCHTNATCENDANIGHYSCTCEGYLIGDGIAECKVENYCLSNPCHTNATCENDANIGNYSCTCEGHLIGDGIAGCKVENYCISDPCHTNATCENDANIGNYSCTCDGALIGDGLAECKVDVYAAVDIDCSDTSMSITIENSVFHNITFALKNKSCIFTNNGTHNTITIDFDTCGTTISEDEVHIIYSNRAKTSLEAGAIITRDPFHYIGLKCKFERSVNITSDRLNVTNFDTINITKGDTTTFTITLNLYATPTFNGSPYTSNKFPLQVNLLDYINVGLNLNTSNDDVKLIPQNCYATPTSSPSDATKHYIVQNRCGIDTTYEEFEITRISLKFSLKAFQFHSTSDVYVHCQLVICENGSSAAECTYGCGSRKRRDTYENSDVKEGIISDQLTEMYTLTSQQITLIVQANNEETKESSSTSNMIMLASMAVGLVIVLVLVFALVLVYRMKFANQSKPNQDMKVIA